MVMQKSLVANVPTPFRRIVAYVFAATLLIRIPCWILVNLLPAWRPRRSWTIRKSVGVNVIRYLFEGLGRFGMDCLFYRPTHKKLETGRGANGVYVGAVPELITGQVKEWAEKANVQSVQLPGYWMHKKGLTIPVEQKPSPDEKVVYFLHGGAYITLSAHPKSPTSIIPLGFLKFIPEVKRSFAIEYRLSSIPPEPTEGPFPSALIDAIAGYVYLINKVGYKPEQVIVAGDSAGGNLAHALTLYLSSHKGKVEGLPDVPGALILISPWTDMSGSHNTPTSSVITNLKSDYLKPPSEPYSVDAPTAFIAPFGKEFTSQTAYISPASKQLPASSLDYSGFPKTFITAGDAEVLLDQIRELSKRMKGGMGERVVYYEAKDAFHDYLCIDFAEPERSETLRAIADFVKGGEADERA
ncbi:alpha/beta-hydrolase [Fomitiporia mediterranea MF3/22]|uniref:alpha/beta-hydrolase n=1 Tax=Fomitiporia mediterranea (strain MF3/22) TaxID=694068 RepID=UPI00044088F2|nr:alpha/beta-hydrolase [Fomitiporia mediterranea MF3/22]EJD03407.1 alpha/beta-hydrolase [Fomitiporia mediterranea MF3/22]